jgi:hypothetical protein
LRALAQPSSAAYPRRRLVFARKGFREYSERDDWKSCGAICCEICSCGGPSPDDEYGTTMYDGNDYTY